MVSKRGTVMKFLITKVSEVNKSRQGSFIKEAGVSFPTPMLLLHTQGASIPYLSPDVLETVILPDEQALEVSIMSAGHMSLGCAALGKGITKYAGLDSKLNVLTLKNPSTLAPSGFHERNSVPIFARTGKKLYNASNYMDVVESFKPDIYHALCDGDTFEGCSKKRVQNAIDRSVSMFVECLERHKNSTVLKDSMFIAPLEGGYDLAGRSFLIKQILEHDSSIDGYFIDGLHTNGPAVTAMNMKQMEEVVSKTIELIPENKPRFMFGPYNPLTVLELIQAGIDVLDSSYPFLATNSHRALTFNYDLKNDVQIDYDMDLADMKYKEEFIPILDGCTCLACRKHTRAYINHLVNTRELLASILLMIHNLHHYIGFFKAIRSEISEGHFSELYTLIKRQVGIDRQFYDLTKLQDELKDANTKNPPKKSKKRTLDEDL